MPVHAPELPQGVGSARGASASRGAAYARCVEHCSSAQPRTRCGQVRLNSLLCDSTLCCRNNSCGLERRVIPLWRLSLAPFGAAAAASSRGCFPLVHERAKSFSSRARSCFFDGGLVQSQLASRASLGILCTPTSAGSQSVGGEERLPVTQEPRAAATALDVPRRLAGFQASSSAASRSTGGVCVASLSAREGALASVPRRCHVCPSAARR